MSEDRPPHDQAHDETPELLPGWSALVVMLTIFALITLGTLITILRGEPDPGGAETGGLTAFAPEDIVGVELDVLLPEQVSATGAGALDTFNLPPPPFSEDIFPCSECHMELEPDLQHRTLEMMHEEIVLDHGPEDRWCFDCHNPDDRDRLRLANGTLIGFEQSYRLCGQCHGTIYRDWRFGIHGRRRGYWNGAKSYLLCAHCHDPHAPRFRPLVPLPPPVRPQHLEQTKEAHHEGQ